MCTKNETEHWMERANDLFTVLCGVTTVLLNTIVLYIAIRYVDFHIKLNQIFVVNMTVSDLVYGLVYMSTKQLVACFPGWLCACYYILIWTSQIGSVFFLLCLNIDKFISLSAPLHYHIYVTEGRVKLVWMLFWTVPVSYSIFSYFGPWIVFPNSQIPCQIGLHPIYYASAIIIFYIVPLTISACISVYIYLLAHKKTRWCAQSAQLQAGEKKKARKQLLKRVFFVFSSTLWSTITILPYRLAYSIYTFACVGSSPPSVISSNLNNITTTISPLSSSSFPGDSDRWRFQYSSTTPAGILDSTSRQDAWSMCQSEPVNVLIYVLFCLPPLGAVGNPIITIVTQQFYRSKAARVLISCLTAVHAPKWMSSANSAEPKTINANEYSKSDDNTRRMRGSTSEREQNPAAVPLLLT